MIPYNQTYQCRNQGDTDRIHKRIYCLAVVDEFLEIGQAELPVSIRKRINRNQNQRGDYKNKQKNGIRNRPVFLNPETSKLSFFQSGKFKGESL